MTPLELGVIERMMAYRITEPSGETERTYNRVRAILQLVACLRSYPSVASLRLERERALVKGVRLLIRSTQGVSNVDTQNACKCLCLDDASHSTPANQGRFTEVQTSTTYAPDRHTTPKTLSVQKTLST